jgi:hypothetical protein
LKIKKEKEKIEKANKKWGSAFKILLNPVNHFSNHFSCLFTAVFIF